MFTGVFAHAEPAWLACPLVNCRRVSASPVLPLNVITVAEELKPLLKSTPVPPATMLYVAVETGLFESPAAAAIALIVVVFVTWIGPLYKVEAVVGVVPFVV